MKDSLIFGGQNDKGVCPCCPTESHVAADGTVLVAYRSQVHGFRDTWICRTGPQADFTFSAPIPVVPPTWKFDGCPHDGPSLTIFGNSVHVAWMDAHSGRQRAYYGKAELADMKFQTKDLNAAGPGTQGNAKLSIDDKGRLHAVWEESLVDEPGAAERGEGDGHNMNGGGGHQQPTLTGASRAVMYACSTHADGKFESTGAVLSRPGHFQIRPAIACGPNALVVTAWMELDESGKRVVVTVIEGGPWSRIDLRSGDSGE
jgi:hypothetical protein